MFISIICILIAFVSVVMVLISYKAFYDAHVNFFHDKALEIVKILSEEVNGDKIRYYIEKGKTDEEYDECKNIFTMRKRL